MYSLPLGGGGDGGEESLGVMVIKSKDKTKAKQRKGALSNWKVCSNLCWGVCRYVLLGLEWLRLRVWEGDCASVCVCGEKGSMCLCVCLCFCVCVRL